MTAVATLLLLLLWVVGGAYVTSDRIEALVHARLGEGANGLATRVRVELTHRLLGMAGDTSDGESRFPHVVRFFASLLAWPVTLHSTLELAAGEIDWTIRMVRLAVAAERDVGVAVIGGKRFVLVWVAGALRWCLVAEGDVDSGSGTLQDDQGPPGAAVRWQATPPSYPTWAVCRRDGTNYPLGLLVTDAGAEPPDAPPYPRAP